MGAEKVKLFLKSNMKLTIAVITCCLLLVGLSVLLKINNLFTKDNEYSDNTKYSNETKYPLVYVSNDGELKYLFFNDDKGNKITNEFLGSLSDIKHANNSKKFIWADEDGNLYLYELNSKDKEKLSKIATGLKNGNYYDISKDGKNVYYVTNDNVLYKYTNGKSTQIDTEVEFIYYFGNNIVIYESQGVYLKVLDDKDNNRYKITNRLVENMISYEIEVNEDETKISYSTYESPDSESPDSFIETYYIYDVKTKKNEKIFEEKNTLTVLSKDFDKLIYVEELENAKLSSLLINDSKYEEDKTFKEINFYVDETNNSYYYNDENGNKVEVSKERYEKYIAEKKDKEFRDKLREEIEKYDTYFARKNVYYQKGSNKKLLAENVSDIINSNLDSLQMIYYIIKTQSTTKIDITSIDSIDKIREIFDSVVVEFYYKNDENAKPILIENVDKIKSNGYSYLPIKNDFYYFLNSDDDNQQKIYYVNLKNGNKLRFEFIGTVNSDSEHIMYNNKLVFLDGIDMQFTALADLKMIDDGKIITIEENVWVDKRYDNYFVDNGNVYYYINRENNKIDFYKYNIETKTKEKLLTDINKVYYLGSERMFVIKKEQDSKLGNERVDLYKYENNKLKLIERNISNEKFLNIKPIF